MLALQYTRLRAAWVAPSSGAALRLRRAVALFGVLASCLSAQHTLELRDAATPDVLRLLAPWQEKPVALLLRPKGAPTSQCTPVSQIRRELDTFGLPLLLLHPRGETRCATLSDAAQADQPSAATAKGAAWELMIVDSDRRVRLARSFGPETPIDAAAVGRLWLEGRQAFRVHCAHCHGNDGAETAYVNIKTLARVARRLSREKIIEGGQQFGAVDLASWRPREIDALLLFIGGL